MINSGGVHPVSVRNATMQKLLERFLSSFKCETALAMLARGFLVEAGLMGTRRERSLHSAK